MRRKKCTTIREGLARWLKEGPKSRQREDLETLRWELLEDLPTQLLKQDVMSMEAMMRDASETVLEQESGANSAMGAQTNITRLDH